MFVVDLLWFCVAVPSILLSSGIEKFDLLGKVSILDPLLIIDRGK